MVDKYQGVVVVGVKMSEERRCPVYYKSLLYEKPPCDGKILRKEPLISSEGVIGHISGAKNFYHNRTGDETCFYYLYVCENGHIVYRPDWWADVPIVSPGTIKSAEKWGETINKTPKWYKELSEEGKTKIWRR